jgi:hypothetical protein
MCTTLDNNIYNNSATNLQQQSTTKSTTNPSAGERLTNDDSAVQLVSSAKHRRARVLTLFSLDSFKQRASTCRECIKH